MLEKTHDQKNMTIKLRAHHIMCFHGYSGRGYNDAFVKNMNFLKLLFLSEPDTLIEITSSPDIVCSDCPNLSDDGCFEDSEANQELRIRNRDLSVMKHLGISEGDTFQVKDVFKRAEECISSEMLNEICFDCPWLPMSSCAKNIELDFWDKEISD